MKMRFTLLAFTLVLASCDIFFGGSSSTPVSVSDVPSDATWYARDIRDDDGLDRLTRLHLTKTGDETFELFMERFNERNSDEVYEFADRFYVEFAADGNENNIGCSVVGIRTGFHDSVLRPGDAGFEEMVQNLGFETCTFDITHFENRLVLTFPEGAYRLSHELFYDYESIEELEHNGELRTGNYREYASYYPSGDEFRLVIHWYFTYRTDTGSSVSVSSSYDIYGRRTFDGVQQAYLCTVDAFSNSAFPRRYYTENSGAILYQRFINSLGFSTFRERLDNGTTYLDMSLEDGSNLSWELLPTPL